MWYWVYWKVRYFFVLAGTNEPFEFLAVFLHFHPLYLKLYGTKFRLYRWQYRLVVPPLWFRWKFLSNHFIDQHEILQRHSRSSEQEFYSFGDLLIFLPAPPAGSHFWFWVKCLNTYWMNVMKFGSVMFPSGWGVITLVILWLFISCHQVKISL